MNETLPGRASDAGPDSHDPREDWDAYDWLVVAEDLARDAIRAPRGAERLAATRESADALANSIKLQELEIKKREVRQ